MKLAPRVILTIIPTDTKKSSLFSLLLLPLFRLRNETWINSIIFRAEFELNLVLFLKTCHDSMSARMNFPKTIAKNGTILQTTQRRWILTLPMFCQREKTFLGLLLFYSLYTEIIKRFLFIQLIFNIQHRVRSTQRKRYEK